VTKGRKVTRLSFRYSRSTKSSSGPSFITVEGCSPLSSSNRSNSVNKARTKSQHAMSQFQTTGRQQVEICRPAYNESVAHYLRPAGRAGHWRLSVTAVRRLWEQVVTLWFPGPSLSVSSPRTRGDGMEVDDGGRGEGVSMGHSIANPSRTRTHANKTVRQADRCR
jgi:hypothetical protein